MGELGFSDVIHFFFHSGIQPTPLFFLFVRKDMFLNEMCIALTNRKAVLRIPVKVIQAAEL